METLSAIITHGLCVRQIPRVVVSHFDMRHFQDGDTVTEVEIPKERHAWIKKHHADARNFRFDDSEQRVFRRYARRERVPEHAGFWMCKQEPGTSSRVEWSKKTDNLAPTLEESVALFLSKLIP